MKIKLTAILVALLFASMAVWAADGVTEEENKILTLVLKQAYSDGGYTVVSPEARFSHMGGDNAKEIKQSKEFITQDLQTKWAGVGELVDRLFKRNKKPVQLSIKSSPKDGYLIDFDGKYAKYFEKDGGGWDKWYKEHPKAHGDTTVSLPVYDQKSGMVLVYKGTQSHWEAGAGFVILYKYEKGELKELGRVNLWVS